MFFAISQCLRPAPLDEVPNAGIKSYQKAVVTGSSSTRDDALTGSYSFSYSSSSETEHGSGQNLVFERMLRRASERRLSGQHVREGRRLVLNHQSVSEMD